MIKSQKNVDIGAHFHKLADQYQEVVHGTNKELYQNVRIELNKHLRGTILDIGNGNVFNYDLEKLDRVIAVDLAFKDLKNTERITYFNGDARKLYMVGDKTCDFVVMQFLIHHIVDQNKSLTDQSLDAALRECKRVLKPGGKLIIVEMLVWPVVEFFENLLYSVNFRLLSWINKPMIRFYSSPGLFRRLNSAHFYNITDFEISMGNWIDPFEALFPGKIKLPRFLYPAECRFIMVTNS